jgi:hypothetical protein
MGLEVWMSKMVEVVIDSLRVSLTNSQRVLVLHARKEDRYLPIWIGPYEAEAITIILQEIEVSRPLTHDLLKNVFKALHAKLIPGLRMRSPWQSGPTYPYWLILRSWNRQVLNRNRK